MPPRPPTFFELARQALLSVEEGYDRLAPNFDATSFRTPDSVAQLIAAQVRAAHSSAVLDVCCGTGAVLAAVARRERGTPRRLVGLDISAGMLAVAAKHLEGRAELVRGDALDMPFVEEFDAVVSAGAFGHIVDEARFLASILRALRPCGTFVFVTGELPRATLRLQARAFNAAMRVRNALVSPPFVMYYLTFLWPDVRGRLLAAGFREVVMTRVERPAREDLIVVTARKG